jgi:glycosyltransferase involved in cell wall biosynthesis
MKVAILNYHSAPYRDAVFAALRKQSQVCLDVLTLFEGDSGHAYWGNTDQVNCEIKLGKSICLLGGRHWHPRLRSVLRENKYDCVVVSGNYHLTSCYLLLYAAIRRIPIVYMTDKVVFHRDVGYRHRLTQIKQRILGLLCGTFWVPGAASASCLQEYGRIKAFRIFKGAYTLDSEAIRTDYDRWLLARIESRRALGILKDTCVFLMAANMLKNREHAVLVEGFAEACHQNPNMTLILLGEGPELATISERVQQYHLEHKVVCVGGVKFADMAKWYSLADVYVHSGAEPYSSALVYGAIVGLPLLATNGIGAGVDVLIDEKNGFIVPRSSARALSDKMLVFSGMDKQTLRQMGCQSRDLAQHLTPAWAADQLRAAIDTAIEMKGRYPKDIA